jgi:hypothetical protein
MKAGTGTFINRKTKTSKKTYDRFFIYIPTELARDTNFPFTPNDKVQIEINGKTLTITKNPTETQNPT